MLVHYDCGEPWSSVRESSNAFNTTKGLPANQYESYENTLTQLARGETTGLHIHPSVDGMLSADIKGFGKGRGAARIFFEVADGVIDVIQVVLDHKF